jgi:hypothetical protein
VLQNAASQSVTSVTRRRSLCHIILQYKVATWFWQQRTAKGGHHGQTRLPFHDDAHIVPYFLHALGRHSPLPALICSQVCDALECCISGADIFFTSSDSLQWWNAEEDVLDHFRCIRIGRGSGVAVLVGDGRDHSSWLSELVGSLSQRLVLVAQTSVCGFPIIRSGRTR